MKIFSSLKKLLIYYENNKIIFENYFNNRREIIPDVLQNNFCIDESFESLIYSGYDGNLYDVSITTTGVGEKMCILERKSGNAELIPINLLKRNNEKYYIYMLKNTGGEHLLALQKGGSIPETVGTVEKIFGVGYSTDILSFAFKNENKIIIKNYNFNSDSFETSYIINTDFTEILSINCFYENNQIVILAAGITQEGKFEILSFNEKGSETIFVDENLNLPEKIYYTSDNLILEYKDYYLNFNKEYPKDAYELLLVKCCNKAVYLLVPANKKLKYIFDKINSIEIIYNKHIKRIEALENEISFSQKQILNVLDELKKLC